MHGKMVPLGEEWYVSTHGGVSNNRATIDDGITIIETDGMVTTEMLVNAARDELRMQRRRPLFEAPHIFDYQPWRLMIEVFVANSCNRRLSVTDACLVLGGPQTTAMRCLAMIEKHGLLVSSPDPSDARRRLLRLSPGSERIVKRYLTDLLVAGPQSRVERYPVSA